MLFTFLVPLILILFRNSEAISNFLGRSTSKENYITFNVEEDSIFRKLRIITFRNSIGDYSFKNIDEIINSVIFFNNTNKKKILLRIIGDGDKKYLK